jgi:hypothetical protein
MTLRVTVAAAQIAVAVGACAIGYLHWRASYAHRLRLRGAWLILGVGAFTLALDLPVIGERAWSWARSTSSRCSGTPPGRRGTIARHAPW